MLILKFSACWPTVACGVSCCSFSSEALAASCSFVGREGLLGSPVHAHTLSQREGLSDELVNSRSPCWYGVQLASPSDPLGVRLHRGNVMQMLPLQPQNKSPSC